MKNIQNINQTSNVVKKIFTSLILFTLLAVVMVPNAASAYSYVNTGYQYTDYNAGPVNYYNHPSSAQGYGGHSNYQYTNTYPVYYPQYYPVYYAVPQQPVCPTYNYNYGPYYESPEYSPRCSDRVEDYGNRYSRPNQFLTELSYATGAYYTY